MVAGLWQYAFQLNIRSFSFHVPSLLACLVSLFFLLACGARACTAFMLIGFAVAIVSSYNSYLGMLGE